MPLLDGDVEVERTSVVLINSAEMAVALDMDGDKLYASAVVE